MKAIFASKLYKVNSRKDKIASAFSNPINVELVRQLSSYLNEPEVADVPEDNSDVSKTVTDKPKVKLKDNKPKLPNTKSTPSTSNNNASKYDERGIQIPSEDTNDSTDDVPDESSEDSAVDEELKRFHEPGSKDETESEEDVKESQKVQGSTALYTDPVKASCCDKIRIDAEVLKGTLNSRESTNGVSRISYKDNELWIYYQDKVNLNSIMEPVIELMNASDFAHFEFNRLARSSNAIVFDVTCIPDAVDPTEEVDKNE